jgi:hypothetical protein
LLLALLGGIAIGRLWSLSETALRLYDNLLQETNQLRQELTALRESVNQAQPRRHTHATAAGIEDALAVAINLILEAQSEREYTEARLRQLQAILGQVREGPLAYDQERANNRPGKRAK